jgi:hypothetical protein
VRTQERDILSERRNANPYAPPGAIVADPVTLEARLEKRPWAATAAIYLVWISSGLGILFSGYNALTEPSPVPKSLLLIVWALVYAPGIWLSVKLIQGRNWARVTFMVLIVAGGALELTDLGRVPHTSAIDQIAFTIQTCLALATLALLLSGSARRWFKPPISSA